MSLCAADDLKMMQYFFISLMLKEKTCQGISQFKNRYIKPNICVWFFNLLLLELQFKDISMGIQIDINKYYVCLMQDNIS